MSSNPNIIRIGTIMYVFTVSFPRGSVKDLIPPAHIFSGISEVYHVQPNTHFAYTLIPPSRLLEHRKSDIAIQTEINNALDYIWAELVHREIARGPRPELITGDPFKMLPS